MKKVSFFIIVLVLVFITGCLTACSPRIVERVERQTDTCYVSRQQRDSIYLRDSICLHEYQKGDTVYVELTRWRTAFRDRLKTDTIYISKTDTVATTVTVECKPSWTDSWRAKVVIVALILLLFFLASKRHE